MLPFFSDPYKDELLYSAFARYHYYSGNIDLKDTLRELFGKDSVIPSFEIGNHLQFFCDAIGKHYSPNCLIQEHTLFPFYAPFLSIDRKKEVLKAITVGDGQGVYAQIGIVAGSICKKESIYYCSTCVKADILQFGEPYIHREHQLQGIMVCPHHEEVLKKYVSKKSDIGRLEYIRLDEKLLDLSNLYLVQDGYHEKLVQISKAAYYLLTHDLGSISKADILFRYKNLLYEIGLATNNLRIKQNELHELFLAHYGVDLLNVLESSVDKQDEYSWLRVVTRDLARTVHPLRHILLILFLAGDIDAFFKDIRKEYNPFGVGPWPCLNNASEHYRQEVVNDLKITADYKKRKPIGTFTCECGYIYARIGPDRAEEDRYHKGRVKAFGTVWENRLRILISEKKHSYRKLANYMGCDIKTVQKIEVALTEKLEPLIDKSLINNNSDKSAEAYKNKILSLLNDQPGLSRTALRKLCQKEYIFLYRHDKEWLFTVLPVPKKAIGKRKTVDWDKRDKELLSCLKKVYIELIKSEDLIRITRSLLGKKINKLALLEKNIDKLPVCKAFINKVSETKQQFQLRRCQIIILKLKKDDLFLSDWKIQKQAGLRKEDYLALKDQIVEIENCEEMNNV